MTAATWWGRHTDTGKPPPEDPVATGRVPTWTGGEELASRGVRLLLWLALAAGPAALFLQYTAAPPPPRSSAPAAADLSVARTATSEAARTWVVTWLTTPSTGAAALAGRYPQIGAPLTLPQQAAQADRPAVASASPGADGVWSVVVGVDVTEPGATGSTRRWYQVPVRWSEDGVAVLTLPAPVAGPQTVAAPPSAYRHRLETTGVAGQTVGAFLGALVAGQSDVTRYVSPTSRIRAITPPLTAGVRLVQLTSDTEVTDATLAGSPDGGTVHLLATVDLVDGPAQARTAQYALTLTSRAGRWEVADVDPAPRTLSP